MTLLERINGPEDLKHLTQDQLSRLASEIRDVLVETVTRTSGHLGPNLGVVELTIALHRVFDSPRDRIIFDTGHQSYVHKLLTGRRAAFDTLRQPGGLSGYPSQAESEHDLVENSHASTSLSWADGMAKAYRLRGETDRTVTRTPIVGYPLYGALHGAKKGLKDFLQPQVLFEDLGIKYIGPIDGHDEQMLEHALRKAAEYGSPVIVHAITKKGFGYLPAEQNE